MTYSPPSPEVNSDQKALVIWDVRTGIEKRSFTMETGQNLWPIFRWSHNDQYFARIVGDVLSVYTTPVSTDLFYLYFNKLFYAMMNSRSVDIILYNEW